MLYICSYIYIIKRFITLEKFEENFFFSLSLYIKFIECLILILKRMLYHLPNYISFRKWIKIELISFSKKKKIYYSDFFLNTYIEILCFFNRVMILMFYKFLKFIKFIVSLKILFIMLYN